MLGGLLLFFVVVGTIIEWPEKAVRWLLKKKAPPIPPELPRHHKDFDDPV